MPTYEYRCKECGHELEAVQSFHDDPLTECPSCGGDLRKKFGSVGISFKGSGFYKNDSRSTTSKTTSTSESTEAASTASSDSGSTSSETTSGSSDDAKPSSSSSGTDSGSKSKAPAAT
jgi:putative FmdB family regulatory protein